MTIVQIDYVKFYAMSQEDILVYLQERGFDVELDFLAHLDEQHRVMVYSQEPQHYEVPTDD